MQRSAANIGALFEQLSQEVARVEEQSERVNEALETALINAIRQTMNEIKEGANSDYFHLITLLNFIISTRHISREDVEEFLIHLKSK